MSERVRYERQAAISTLVMDDGKANAMSSAMLAALNAALDRAQADRTVVVLTGREQVFSAGFDLATLKRGGADAREMLVAGARIARRLLAHPAPVVVAINGHAVAMGAFLALGADLRMAAGDVALKITANEVAIGLTLPRFATEILRHRLTPAHFDRAAVTAHSYDAVSACAAGWIDEVVPAAQLSAAAAAAAQALAALDRGAHAATKLRVREPLLAALDRAIEADLADWNTRL